MSSGKVAIVFGGAGFIGTHLIRELRATSQYSRIVIADIRPPVEGPVEGVEHVRCDVRDPIGIAGPFDNAEVYNLGAIHTTPGHQDWEYFNTNVHGAININRFAESIGAKVLLFTSSISVYGPTEEARDESGPLMPESAYGRSKQMAEEIHRLWQQSSPDRRLVIVRPAVIFGAGESGNFTRLAKALKAGTFAYPGRRDTIKSCGYVGELVRTMLFMRDQDRPEVTYNFAYPERYNSEQICEAFHRVGGFSKPKFVIPLGFMLAVGFAFEVLAALGLKTSVNRARVLKLVKSTNIIPGQLMKLGYRFETDLESGLRSWKDERQAKGFV